VICYRGAIFVRIEISQHRLEIFVVAHAVSSSHSSGILWNTTLGAKTVYRCGVSRVIGPLIKDANVLFSVRYEYIFCAGSAKELI
jgi:hypothetical protein